MIEYIKHRIDPEKWGAIAKLAHDSQIDYSTIKSWLRRNSRPNVEHAKEIAKVFDVSLDFLITGSDYLSNFDQIAIDILKDLRGFPSDELERIQVQVRALKIDYEKKESKVQ